MQNYHFSTNIILISQLEIFVSYSKYIYISMYTCMFLIVILKKTLVRICLASNLDTVDS